MSNVRRPIALCLFVLVLVVFWFVPRVFAFETAQLQMWATMGQIGGPLLAAMLCFRVARESSGADRTAWLRFAIGSSLYVLGNLFYVYYAVVGTVPPFPALPEATYFVMAAFFAAGMYYYGSIRGRVSHVQFYNFVLFYCSITLATIFLLHGHIVESVMDPFATAVAFLYPALWFSVAAFGLITMFLYDSGEKARSFALLILAVSAEASADLIYALDLMRGSYQIGGITQFLWVASAGLIALAAFERLQRAENTEAVADTLFRRIDGRAFVQAVTPAAALALVLLPGVYSGVLGNNVYLGLAAALAVVFATAAGLREHWIINDQRRLRREREKASASLARSQQRLTSVLESTGDSVVVLDRDWRIEFLNQRALAAGSNLSKVAIGAPFWDILPGGKKHPSAVHLGRAVDSQVPVEFEVEVGSRGAWFAVGAYPSSDGLSIFFRDISESRRVREEIAYLAHHDPLTGLVNRSLFRERLTAAAASGAQAAVLLLDLDHFKEINDTFGHPAGDSLLVAIAGRLRQCLRLDDTIARLGGDEFAVLLVNHASHVEVARLARRIVAAVSAPHTVSGQSMRVGASLGIAFSEEDNADPDRIFKNADIALYAAKAEATGEFRFFEPAMETAVQERQALRADLRAALDNDEFEVVYQPLFDFRLNRVCGFEALLRWRHPTRGMISPEIFIPIAEDTGLIIALGDWVFETACTAAATW
ncbi:MAG: diguanylate cyclase, partial [Mesorhizobium sp.]|nr:diguanylate cyclase [Mesorhizobium sp.]